MINNEILLYINILDIAIKLTFNLYFIIVLFKNK